MGNANQSESASKGQADLSALWSDIAKRSQTLVQDFLSRQAEGQSTTPEFEELALLVRPYQTYLERLSLDPQNFLNAQSQLWQDTFSLWQRFGERALNPAAEPVISPERGDRRFKAEEWSENPLFDFTKQAYLLSAKSIAASLPKSDGPGDIRAKQLEFYTRQFIDAMSPTNFLASNPTVLKETLDTGGQNLVRGLRNVLEDLERGHGQLRTKMTDPDAFTVGENVGASTGSVVYQNELMQLIQYRPSTKQVRARPLVILPPWINKFYILDLQPKNSFIKWAVDQGHTVFVVSWVNPGPELAEKSFDDYLMQGALTAIDVAGEISGEPNVDMVGYCLGGTLLASTLAYMAATDDDRVKSATFFASLTDFSEPGDLGVFIDEEHINLIDKQMERDGYLDGASMASAFNALRANDLIWSFVVNNYLMGKDPFPFDLLYWNSDSTRMPRAMHSFYLREMYLNNRLREQGAITLNGVAIDLRKIRTPTYLVATLEDHIAPWRSTYCATQLFGGPVRFVLGGSGHIAGIINPPQASKYGYRTNESLPVDPQEWFDGATVHQGSWWPDWQAWLDSIGDERVKARAPEAGPYPVLEAAPGSYVQVRDLA